MAGKITPDQLPEKLDGILSEFLHSSFAYGQRAANRQPGFGLIGLATSPCSSSLRLWQDSILGIGIAFSSACV